MPSREIFVRYDAVYVLTRGFCVFFKLMPTWVKATRVSVSQSAAFCYYFSGNCINMSFSGGQPTLQGATGCQNVDRVEYVLENYIV